MSVSIRTKDGSFSTAGAILAHETTATRHVLIDMDGALEWARTNNVRSKKGALSLDQINARRTALGLPLFRIIKGSDGKPKASKSHPVPPVAPIARTEEELLDLVLGSGSSRMGLVTPQIADWLLKLNTGNRPINRRQVERFKQLLANRKWMNTGEPVIVSEDSILNDGQHRLTAIVEANISAELDIRFGIPREAFHATGTGKVRSARHVLAIEGYGNTTCQAAMARLIIHYDKHQMAHQGQVENGDILAIVDADDHICEIAAKIQRSKFPPTRTGTFGFVLAIAARSTPLERVFEFADLVTSGRFESQDESEPTRCLHVKLRDVALRKGERLNALDFAVLTVKAWNAWVRGERMLAIRVNNSDRSNVGFPDILERPEEKRLAA